MMHRVQALVGKELLDLRSNPGLFLPAVLTGLLSIVLPIFITVVVPRLTGEGLAGSADFAVALELYGTDPATKGLDPEGVVQAWVFQQFLVLLLLSPIAGAMSIAAYAVIGEKQARTLEPLLVTPLTTVELLAAKVLGSLIPAIGLALGCFAVYLFAIWLLAAPDVYLAMLTFRAVSLMFLIGPLAALAALQMAVCVSSRVNDARSAQQIGALVILPLSGLLVAQLTGRVQLTTWGIVVTAMVLTAVNAALVALGVLIFDRESILTRWK